MKTTLTLSANLNTSPFYVFDQDADEVIMLINYFIKLGNEKRVPDLPKRETAGGAPQRIRVNDATATGGWF